MDTPQNLANNLPKPDELSAALKEYVEHENDSKESQLINLLKSVSVDQRYELLAKKYGRKKGTTALHMAASSGALNLCESMLEEMKQNQKYNLLILQNTDGHSAVLFL